MTTDKNSMLYWYPLVKDIDVPQPKTVIVEMSLQSDSITAPINKHLSQIRNAVDAVGGYPVFMRTDLMSGKFNWSKTCYCTGEPELVANIQRLVEFSENCDMIGRPVSALVFREFIEIESAFRAFHGLPISKERRYFVRDGKVECSHPYWCCSSDTEILTEDGFKLFPELEGSEKVFTLNPDNGEIELITPIRKIGYHYKGNMVHIKNRSFDMLVTPEHRIPIMENNGIRLIEAKDIRYNSRIPRTGLWIGNSKTHVEIAGREYPAHDFFEFLGYYLAEGCYSPPTKSNSDRLALFQKREGIFPIVSCLNRLGIDHTISEGKSCCSISIHKKEYSDLARYLDLGKSYEKFIPSELKEYSPESLKAFLDAFLYGDGSIRDNADRKHKNPHFSFRSTGKVYYTSSVRLANDICELILKVGKRPSLYQYHKKKPFQIKGKRYSTKHPVFTIRECNSHPFITKHPSAMPNNNKPFVNIDYDGMVYCVELPKNHIIYIKRNGKCSWTGNCEEAIRFWRSPDEPHGWRTKLENLNYEDIEEVELLTGYAGKVASVLPGYWSVDFCHSRSPIRGMPFDCMWWYFIDCALGENSWHPECQLNHEVNNP